MTRRYVLSSNLLETANQASFRGLITIRLVGSAPQSYGIIAGVSSV
jgi:hypothetical protein